MEIFHRYKDLNEFIKIQKQQGKIIALVPTMGALHAGHLALMEEAKTHADIVICSIFVNPTQFAPHEDFDLYPRPIEADIVKLEQANIDILYAPTADEIYPENEVITAPPIINGDILEGEFRPHFFNGVGLVVRKLLHHCQPDIAIFGQKDYQQLIIIQQMVKSLKLPIKILGIATIREKDGLAKSSRNIYLTTEERKIVPILHQSLTQIANNIDDKNAIIDAKNQILAAGFNRIDYLEIRDSLTLDSQITNSPRILIAAWLGKTRLIDNL